MRLIRGAPGAGKTTQVLNEFREALQTTRTGLRIVVPTATLVRHYQHELARAGEVFPPSAVVSLRRFIDESAPDLKPAPEGLLRAIVRDTLRRLKPPEFSEVAETGGMVSVILDAVALFENAGATPEKLGAVRRLLPHAKAFERIWKAVTAHLHDRGFATRPEIVRGAAARIQNLRVWMDGFVSFSPLELEFVRAIANSCDLTLTLGDSPATSEIHTLALRLGAKDRLLPGTSRKPEVQTIQAPSIERECDEIARRIVDLHSAGTPFREMGVALRDESSYLPLLRGVFERFGIPARFYFSTALRHHPASRFLSGLVASTLGNWEYGQTLDALRAHPGWGASPAFDRFDFAVREAMPGSGANALASLCDPEDEALQKRLTACFAIAGWTNELHPPAEWIERLQQFAQSAYRPGLIDPAAGQHAVETHRSHVAALDAWLDAIECARGFWSPDTGPISLEAFWRIAAEALDGASVRIRDDRREVVHIMSAYEARQWDVSTLFVCGLTARDYPQRHARNLLLTESDYDILRRSGIALRRADDLNREEAFLFQSLLTRARSSVLLSWPSHDAAGRKVQSSRFVMELAAPSKARLCRPAVEAALPAQAVSRRIESTALLDQLAAHHKGVSMTALEELAQCRFKFFAKRTLSLKDRPERPSERLKPLIWGSILHQALEEWLKVKRLGDFVPLFEEAFDKAVREAHLPQGYRLEAERILLRETARKVSASEKWIPLSSEAEVEVALNFPGGITVSGRIDRLDRLNERECIIVDYKSSKVANVEKLIESATRLQGPLYALAAREQLHLKTIAMMYFAVREDKRFGWGEVPNADLGLQPMPENWVDDAKTRTINRITDFLSGSIHAEPTERGECRWCDFKEACRYTEQQALIAIAAGQVGQVSDLPVQTGPRPVGASEARQNPDDHA